jgi:hypothetical protein
MVVEIDEKEKKQEKEENKTKGKGKDQGKKNAEILKDNELDAPKNTLSCCQRWCILLWVFSIPLKSSSVLETQLALE